MIPTHATSWQRGKSDRSPGIRHKVKPSSGSARLPARNRLFLYLASAFFALASCTMKEHGKVRAESSREVKSSRFTVGRLDKRPRLSKHASKSCVGIWQGGVCSQPCLLRLRFSKPFAKVSSSARSCRGRSCYNARPFTKAEFSGE